MSSRSPRACRHRSCSAAEHLLEVLPAAREGRGVEEAHHLLDLGLDVAAQGRQRFVRLVVHGRTSLDSGRGYSWIRCLAPGARKRGPEVEAATVMPELTLGPAGLGALGPGPGDVRQSGLPAPRRAARRRAPWPGRPGSRRRRGSAGPARLARQQGPADRVGPEPGVDVGRRGRVGQALAPSARSGTAASGKPARRGCDWSSRGWPGTWRSRAPPRAACRRARRGSRPASRRRAAGSSVRSAAAAWIHSLRGRLEDALRARQRGDADRLAVRPGCRRARRDRSAGRPCPVRNACARRRRHRTAPSPAGPPPSARPGLARASTNGAVSIRGAIFVGIEQERVLVAMLPQAGRPGQERRVAESLGVGAQHQGDARDRACRRRSSRGPGRTWPGRRAAPRSSAAPASGPSPRAAARLASRSNASRR